MYRNNTKLFTTVAGKLILHHVNYGINLNSQPQFQNGKIEKDE